MAFMISTLLLRPLPRRHVEAKVGHGLEAFQWILYVHCIHMQYYMYYFYNEYYYNNTTMSYGEGSCCYTIPYA